MTEPLERHYTSSAYVVAEGHTLLVWHEKQRTWFPPGGHVEPNEDPVQAAVREALEETGLEVEVISPPDLLVVDQPEVKPPPAVILIEDVERPDQPFHQHIDHVYFTRATEAVDYEVPIPHGLCRWVDRETLANAFSLPAPDGRLVPVAEDVRLLGVRALDAAAEAERRC